MSEFGDLPRFSDFVIGLMESAAQQEYQSETGLERQTMHIEEMRVDLPFEMNLSIAEQGAVTLLASPPTQRTETTVMPVFHQVRLTVRCDKDSDLQEASPYER